MRPRSSGGVLIVSTAEDAREGEAADEAPDGERHERIGNRLDHAEAGRARKRRVERGAVSPLLADDAPEGRGDHARNADHGEDDAGHEDDAVHAALELADVHRHDGLLQEDRELHDARAQEHALHDGNLEEAGLLARGGRLLLLLSRRLVDEE